MYKETIERKIFHVIFALFLILVTVLFSTEIIKLIYTQRSDINNLSVFIFQIGLLVVFAFEVFKCKVKYSYSVIADQFIIHKLIGNEDKVVENIKIQDIEFIGENNKLLSCLDRIKSRKYICSLYCKKTYCCIYKKGEKVNKFYFESSNDLVKKIKVIKNKSLRN
ncbi:hypothetical protein CLOACE_20800 [Clostridium acetireducens DSM 10703]|jgi:hypothetical protein|uniref:Uncharacterized protein n=1 Tax=Clostridium acetireducens DSM 10703 TaxID=1121290 RepID=A0A1E8EW87_9CLOT|nr:hypothetical protein [Clostridium acetireducens]OFI01525.1 hypothetical protein CLOACE_20800 [Clostridium acetireducens DSM 10703]